ncbi:MAG: hypothetical protein WC248_07655 [Candidatus Methanomethylophilaceae archaeon]|jgi:hypothetical protein
MAKFLAVLFILAFLGLLCPGQALPEPYYVNATWNDHSLQGLRALVDGEFTVPFQYGVFDCGERSAYLEWLLQCHGFDAGFCMDGSGPWTVPAGAGYSTHMWVTAALYNDTTGVYTGRVYIETTQTPIKIITWGDPDWDKYARLPDNEVYGMKNFLSIYDIMAGITPNTADDDPVSVDESELDWWTFGTDLIKKPEQKKIRFKTV